MSDDTKAVELLRRLVDALAWSDVEFLDDEEQDTAEKALTDAQLFLASLPK